MPSIYQQRERRFAALGCVAALLVVRGTISPAYSATASWTEPAIDVFAYNNADEPGRAVAPTFIGDLELDASGEFLPRTAAGPARLGTVLAAFDTSSQITPGRPPSQYDVTAVTMTFTMQNGTFGTLHYDDQPAARQQVLDMVRSGSAPAQWPMELYGVGFRSGLVGFDFDGTGDATRFSADMHAYGPDGYRVYPIVGDAQTPGVYHDVSNNITGGFSATSSGGHTAPFDAAPWAIGAANLNRGEAIADRTTFTFAVDLGAPGVRSYVQDGLAAGGLGFILSSLHLAAQPGFGLLPYPQWFLKESAGGFFNGAPPTLSIDYTLADDARSGDYNGDLAVDGADLLVWQRELGAVASPPGAGADGNGDAVVDAADLAVWSSGFVLPAPARAASAVPEPAALPLAACWLPLLAKRRAVSRRRRVRRGRAAAFSLVELLVAIAIIGALVALLLPAIQAAREAARRASCQNHLKQIALAAQNYTSCRGHLPPPKIGNTQFDELGGTFVLLLPYLEQAGRFAQYDPHKPADDPHNLPITGKPVDVYLCPSMVFMREPPEPACNEALGPASYLISTRTDYYAYGALDGAFANPLPDGSYYLAMRHITDGASNTLFVGETNYSHQGYLWTKCAALNGQVKWGDQQWAEGYWALSWGHMAAGFPQAYNNSHDFIPTITPRTFRSDHPGGVQFALLDGSVRMIADGADPAVRLALVTRAGEETNHHAD
ncbi:MAG: hypothetical protein DCC67_08375 [Planctomycetota bacterium]|nr:MAG: hypothetical protein DCC67_08375 [Planctomycetota bacterium]